MAEVLIEETVVEKPAPNSELWGSSPTGDCTPGPWPIAW